MLLRLLRIRLRPYAGLLAVLLVLQLAGTVASLYLPSLNAQIIDDGVATGDTGTILRLGGLMLAVSLGQILASIGATYLAARTAGGLARDLRSAVFHRVGDFSAQEVMRFGAPTLIARGTNDVQQVQQLTFMGAAMMLQAPIMMIGGMVMAIREDRGLSWLLAVVVPLLALVVVTGTSRMLPSFRQMQTSVDTVNRVLREQITGVRVVRAFTREAHEEARFDEANAVYTGTSLRVGRIMAVVFPLVMLIFNTSTAAVVWFGAHRIADGQMQVGQLFAFISYLTMILMSVMMATFMSMMIPRASVSATRITEVLDTPSSITSAAHPQSIPDGPVTLAVDHVSFTYPGADYPVLRDVSFVARPGQTTAIIGSTGAGKSTLLGLLPRLFDATDGAVTMNGVDVRQAPLDEVWAKVGLVPQKAYLFTGTVASNLRYGNPQATDEELWEALRIAQADDFVERMDGGLEAHIAQGGTNVSGGQRQRLAIARAIVARPAVYLFDDSFSALDLRTDARLRAALRPITRHSTTVVVAQRVSTIIDADQIVVLEDGEVAGIGTHDELLATCETYREIVESQRPAEEAA